MKTWLIALLFLPLVVAAEVYRTVDEGGSITYSDRSGPGAEPVKLPGLSDCHEITVSF